MNRIFHQQMLLIFSILQNLKPPPSAEQVTNPETGKTEWVYDEDLDDDHESVVSRLPDDPAPLQAAITASQVWPQYFSVSFFAKNH